MRYVLTFCYKPGKTVPQYKENAFYCLEGIRYSFRSRAEAQKKAREVAAAKPEFIVYVNMIVDSFQSTEPIEHNSFLKEE